MPAGENAAAAGLRFGVWLALTGTVKLRVLTFSRRAEALSSDILTNVVAVGLRAGRLVEVVVTLPTLSKLAMSLLSEVGDDDCEDVQLPDDDDCESFAAVALLRSRGGGDTILGRELVKMTV